MILLIHVIVDGGWCQKFKKVAAVVFPFLNLKWAGCG
jgi:hypothetical protein